MLKLKVIRLALNTADYNFRGLLDKIVPFGSRYIPHDASQKDGLKVS